MGYTYSFVDNAEYAAADVNNTIKRLVSSGIEDPFEDGIPYNVTKLNDIITAVSSSGAVPETIDTLKCIINSESQTVHINPGTAFFSDGSVITIDNEGETLSYETGVKNYIYLKASPPENKNYPVCSKDAPSGDYVPLAEIDAEGSLTDKRVYAHGKLPGYQSNWNTPMYFSERLVMQIAKPGGYDYTPPNPITIYLGEHNAYRKAIFYGGSTPLNAFGILDLTNGDIVCFYKYDKDFARSLSNFRIPFYNDYKSFDVDSITDSQMSEVHYNNYLVFTPEINSGNLIITFARASSNHTNNSEIACALLNVILF